MNLPTLNANAPNPAEINRRDFFKSGAAVATVALVPGVTLTAFGGEAAANANAGSRWGLLIDVNKCASGCTDCVTACSQENGWEDTAHPETDAQWIRKVDLKDPDSGLEISLPVMCQHCEDAPCIDVCPTGASFKRADGIVLVDKHTCISCRFCMMACPYQARSFVHEPLEDQKSHAPRGKGTVESCTLCVHRIDEGGIPACVEACNAIGHGAMVFGDLKDPDSEIAKMLASYPSTALRDDLHLNPGVRYRNLYGPRPVMEQTIYREMKLTPQVWQVAALLGAFIAAAIWAVLFIEHHGHIVTGMNKHVVWGLPHVFAIFLIVAASGALNVASTASVFGKTAYKPMARLSGLLALALLAGGLAAALRAGGRSVQCFKKGPDYRAPL